MGTFVYAYNDGMDRRRLWKELEVIKHSVGRNPWMLAGDFNVVMSPLKKLGRERLNIYEKEFVDCVFY